MSKTDTKKAPEAEEPDLDRSGPQEPPAEEPAGEKSAENEAEKPGDEDDKEEEPAGEDGEKEENGKKDAGNEEGGNEEGGNEEGGNEEGGNEEGGNEEGGTEEAAGKPSPPAAPPDGKRKAAMVLAVVAAVCAAWFGWSWYAAAHDESLGFSRERDEVLRAGEQAVQNLNTLDHRSLDRDLKLWQDSSTSELYQEIVQGRPQFEKAVQQAKTITSAKVLDAAVTELDRHAGKASVIVGLQITVTPPKGEPAVKKTRLMGQLTRTATGWKLSALSQAPVGGTG
ncbi:hypothetical protein [Actinomadura sp. 21ATH]|uniref:hypothetical protein n=1 Tax=Actinomadura sp. 21ATH TaxID=1735444 RepID=UPI0035C17E3F